MRRLRIQFLAVALVALSCGLSGSLAFADTSHQAIGTTLPLIWDDGSGGHRPQSVMYGMNSTTPTALAISALGSLKAMINEALTAGEAHIGSIGGSIVTVSDAFSARPANTTAYAQGGTWNINLAVSAITTATPMVVTLATNTLAAGDFVTIAGVTGETVANGTWKVGSPDGTHITLLNADGTNSVGSGTYVSGGTVAQLLVFHVGRVASGTGYVVQVQANFKSTTVTNGSFGITFHNSPTVGALVDQSAWPTLAANFASRIGKVDMPTLQVEGAGGDSAFSMATNTNLPFTSDTQGNIYATVTASAAYGPSSAQLATWKVTVDQN